MAKDRTGIYYGLHPVVKRLAKSYIKSYQVYKEAWLDYEASIDDLRGYDEIQKRDTLYKTEFDISDALMNKRIVEAVEYSLEQYVSTEYKEAVKEYMWGGKSFDDFMYPGGVRAEVGKWIYGFAKEFGINTL